MEAAATPLSAPIVVLVDGSRHTRAAVRFAGEWAKATGAPVILRGAMSVWHRSGILHKHVLATLQQEMDRYAAELAATDGIVVSDSRAVVRFGQPAGALAVAGQHPRAVVLGMEGVGGWESSRRAANAQEISTAVDCPVILVPNRGATPPIADRPVVVGLDEPATAAQVLDFGVFWARDHGVPVIVLRDPHVPSLPDPAPEGIDLDDRQVAGDLRPALTELSPEAGLIVLAQRQPHHGIPTFQFLPLLDPHQCACPVAVVRAH